jgi:hypothetical protein
VSLCFAGEKKERKRWCSGMHYGIVRVYMYTQMAVSLFLSDAPAVSEIEKPKETIVDKEASQWDEEALKVASISTSHIALTSNAAELLDIKALEVKGQDDIAERMRLEETKAALAAAREGMEREGQRLKEEQEKKKDPQPTTSGRFAGASSSGGVAETSSMGTSGASGGGSKWVPPHLRSGGSSSLSKIRMSGGGGGSQKLDTQDESLFPDLKEADKILQQEKKQDAAIYKVPKKTAVGGGATWGSRPVIKKTDPPPPEKEKKVEPPSAPAPVVAPPLAPVVAPALAPVLVAAPTTSTDQKPSVGAGLKMKKKKKDLSTFKPLA